MRQLPYSVLLATVLVSIALPAYATDSDRDGVADSIDNCPDTHNPGQEDGDGDGVGDTCDNCPDHWNPRFPYNPPHDAQPDADEDGIGNVCDECTDQDGDGFGDPGFPTNTCVEDNCPGFANPDQLDSDGDGIGDPCEGLECGDVDGDSIVFIGDLFLTQDYMFLGGKSPASMHVANTGGCSGINIFDAVYTYSEFNIWFYRCWDSTNCLWDSVGAVSLDSADGLYAPDTIGTGQKIMFYLRLTNDGTESIDGLTNGFRIYSSAGAEWTGTSVSCLIDFTELEPPVHFNVRSKRLLGMTGSVADTVAIGYWEYQDFHGLPPGFDSITYAIGIGPIPHEHSGGKICLDSCWYPPAGEWMWATEGPDSVPYKPSWDGPHCFTIYNCCQNRGDIDNNGGTNPDISDLIYLVTYMFQEGPAPLCMTAADIDGDEALQPDITDLIYLVQFMFQEGPAPAPCPE